MLYAIKVRCLKRPRLNLLWRKWMVRRGHLVGAYEHLPRHIADWVEPGDSFADIGCMWGVNGRYAFLAEEAGATRCVGVDVFGPTPEFESEKRARRSGVEFVLGDVTRSATIEAVGVVDVVFCAGVLYHHPSPFDVLSALRQMCGRTLILRTSTIPEMRGVENAAVYFPLLSDRSRSLWRLDRLGLAQQVGITDEFDPGEGYGNWFWGLSPSCLIALLRTAGFEVLHRFTEPFAQTVICRAVEVPFVHQLPDADQARRRAADISRAGIARPA